MEVFAVVHRLRKSRRGRGFSRGELKEVGLSFNQALKLGIQIDPKRSTKHDENVKTIMTYLVEEPPTKKPEMALTKAEGMSQRSEQLNAKDTGPKSKLAEDNSKKTAKKLEVPEKTSHKKKIKDAKKPLDEKSSEKKT